MVRFLIDRFRPLVAVSALSCCVGLDASALVTVEHVVHASQTYGGVPGETFDVDVSVTWDGSGSLVHIFTSTLYDDAVLQLVGADWLGFAETAPSILDRSLPTFPFFATGFTRVGGLSLAGDPPSLIRSVQYGAATSPILPLDPSHASTSFVTTLTFEVIGAGPIDIQGGFGLADEVSGDTVEFVTTYIPEPGTAVLLGFGLMIWRVGRPPSNSPVRQRV